MTVETKSHEVDTEEMVCEGGVDAMAEGTVRHDLPERHSPPSSLPRIGALENPRLGPMFVLNESGYFVPLCTDGDLLRGCKYYWHRSQD